MRNLLQYPITKDEMLSTLDKVIEKEIAEMQESERVGDITVVALMEVKKAIDPASPGKPVVALEFTDEEIKALDEIAKQKDLTRDQTIRQALRLYQLYEKCGGSINMPSLPKAPFQMEAAPFQVAPAPAEVCSGTGGEHEWQDASKNTIVSCTACGKIKK